MRVSLFSATTQSAPSPLTSRTRVASRTRRAVGWAAPLVGLGLVLAGMAVPATPAAATTYVASAGGVHVVSTTSTSFVITGAPAAGAKYYRVFASTVRSNVYVANIAAAHASGLSTDPTLGLGGLTFTTSPYSFRIETMNGPYRAWSGIYSLGLQPAAPTSVRLTSATTGTYLTWSSGPSTGARITQATNPTMTASRRTWSIRGLNHQFTPYSLTPGATYYFRVQALNQATASSYSAQVSGVIRSHAQGVRVMTYNLLEGSFDGTPEGGQTVAAWSLRGPVAAGLVREVAPDVLAVQEGANFVNVVRGPRQVDSLLSMLGSGYSLARTEVPPTEPGYFRTGNYLIYNNATFAPAAAGGHWTMPYAGWAAFQLLRNRTSGAVALFLSVHFIGGAYSTFDAERQYQMTWLTHTVAAYVAAHGSVPVIYAGDFNSCLDPLHTFDGPNIAARAANIADAWAANQSSTNARYNSSNQYTRLAPAAYDSIDHIYAPPGVAVATWHLTLHLSAGYFVGVMPSDHNPVSSAMSYPY